MYAHIDSAFPQIFRAAAEILDYENGYRWRIKAGTTCEVEYGPGPRFWHNRLQSKYSLHPVIQRIIDTDWIRPLDWHLLLLEWPHISDDDNQMLAYTRNETAGMDFVDNGSKRQTKTSIGKYLARHWPHVPSDVRRDWAGRFKPARYEFWDTKERVILSIELGPQSCMKSTQDNIPFKGVDRRAALAWTEDNTVSVRWNRHPYACYDPSLGWRSAVRLDAGMPDVVLGRALVYEPEKCFVRSFKRGDSEDAYSHSDEQLEAWLVDQGYEHMDAWPNGTRLAKIDHPTYGGWMAPYIDGDVNRVEVRANYLVIDEDDGRYSCENTDGTMDGGSDDDSDDSSYVGSCVRCDDSLDENDDYTSAGRSEDELVCDVCLCRHYTFVRGATNNPRVWPDGYREYYVRDGQAVTCNGVNYDSENLPDTIVTLHDGDYAEQDDAVYCACDEEYYRTDDDAICQVMDDSSWRLKENCWQDHETDEWWFDTTDQLMPDDGETYHRSTVEAWPTTALQTQLELEGETA
jgi:hypothetical protein